MVTLFPKIFALSCAFATPAFASVNNIYECSFRVASNEVLSPEVVLIQNPETGAFKAYDGFVAAFVGEPIEAQVTQNTDKKLSLRWEFGATNNTGQHTKLSFRLSYFKENGTATVHSKPHGYTNQDSARGNCTISQRQWK